MSSKKISQLTSKPNPSSQDTFVIVDSSDGENKKTTLSDIRRYLYEQKLVFVSTKADLPSAVAGVITLVDDVTYFIMDTVDLTGDRIVSGRNTTIIGGSSENCGLKSTGLNASTALITSQWSIPIRNIFITHGTALNLDASGNPNQAIDWLGVNFVDCAAVGRIANYNNFIMTDSALLNSSGLVFDGTMATIGFTQCLFDGVSGTIMSLPSTANITRRFRIIYSSFVALAGETALNVSTSATIPVEGYILDTINFSGGGTYTAGVQYDDNKALFQNCRGVINTSSVANYYMSVNAVATDIVTTGVAVKAAGTTTAGKIIKFTHSNNRATYIGALSTDFLVTASISVTAGNNNQVGAYIAKNGSIITESEVYSTTSGSGRAENVSIQAVVTLTTNDYVELWVENATTNTDIVVTYLNLIVSSL